MDRETLEQFNLADEKERNENIMADLRAQLAKRDKEKQYYIDKANVEKHRADVAIVRAEVAERRLAERDKEIERLKVLGGHHPDCTGNHCGGCDGCLMGHCHCGSDHDMSCEGHGYVDAGCFCYTLRGKNTRLTKQRDELANAVRQAAAFARSWQPDDKGPMCRQFGKFIAEMSEALERLKEEA